uniref:Headcase N-terminal domain-containing protein n=1 Tax=Ditylenchus dipsaci TaxID=166011 RepID=A0A915CPN8_9BILA
MAKFKTQSKRKKPTNESAQVECAVPSCNSLISCIRKGKPLPTSAREGGVKMSCTNDKCEFATEFVHDACFQHFEEFLVKLLGKRGSARNWTENQRRINLWEKKGVVLVSKFLKCRCGLGQTTKDLDIQEVSNEILPSSPEIKQKKKKKNSLPTLNLGVKFAASVPAECASLYKKKAKELDQYYLSNQMKRVKSIRIGPHGLLLSRKFVTLHTIYVLNLTKTRLQLTGCTETDAKSALLDQQNNLNNAVSAVLDMQKISAQPKIAIVESVQSLNNTTIAQKKPEKDHKKEAVAPVSWAKLFKSEPDWEPSSSTIATVKKSTRRFVSIQKQSIEIAEICAVLELRLKGFKSLMQTISGDSLFMDDENCFDSLPFFSPQAPSIKWQLKVFLNGRRECGEFGTNVHLDLHQHDVLDYENLALAHVQMYFLNARSERVDVTFVGRDAPIYYFRVSQEDLVNAFHCDDSLVVVCEVDYLAQIE